MIRNHYIPKLILRQFAINGKVNTYDVENQCFSTKKLKNVFFEEGLYPNDLEEKFARNLEGPFGDLLNNKLLKNTRTIIINRKENLLIRKFEMISRLRSGYTNMRHEDLIKKLKEEDNFYYHFAKLMTDYDHVIPSCQTFYQDLDKAIEVIN